MTDTKDSLSFFGSPKSFQCGRESREPCGQHDGMVNLLVTGSGLSGLSDVGNQPPFMLHSHGNRDSYQLRSLSIQRASLVAGCLELRVRFPDSRKLFLKIVEKLSHLTLRLPCVWESLNAKIAHA